MRLERRRWPRTTVLGAVRIHLNDAIWTGQLVNISLGGLNLLFKEILPTTDNQPVELGLQTEMGVLAVSGRVRAVRETSVLDEMPSFWVAVEFLPLDPFKQQVLASIIKGVTDGDTLLRITALLTPLDSPDLLLVVGSQQPMVGISSTQAVLQERRLVPRADVSSSALVHLTFAESGSMIRAQAVDLSATGVCLQYAGPCWSRGDQVRLTLGLTSFPQDQTDHYAIETESCLNGRVAWISNKSSVSPASSDCIRAGIQFVNYEGDSQRQIASFVQSLLAAREDTEKVHAQPSVTSVRTEFPNELGQQLFAYIDHPSQVLPGRPVVVVVPGYGETKKEYVHLSYYLALNGLEVLRYDHSNHVGESDGDHTNSTLGRMYGDLCAALDFVTHEWPGSAIIVIATSLSGRVALKVAAKDKRLCLLVLLTAVVDVQKTLEAVHNEDLVGNFVSGVRPGMINMLGFNIHADHWLENAVLEGYANLGSTIRDARDVHVPVLYFAAQHDTWVDIEAVKTAQQASGPLAQLFLIPDALHRLTENPRKARLVYRHVVQSCLRQVCGPQVERKVREPSTRSVGFQNRLERERAKAQRQMSKTVAVEFWEQYLSRFHFIVNVHDYWQLLDHIYRFLGPLEGEISLLDAGCGNGNFGMFLLINQGYQYANDVEYELPAIRYVGLDFVPTAFITAQANLARVAEETALKSQMSPDKLMRRSFVCGDLDTALPFPNNTFDRIVCNLVLGYLEDPTFALAEFLRVLKPKGKLVLTNLKPNSDLSQVYRNFVNHVDGAQRVEEARQLLDNSGYIRRAEGDGIFRFFDSQEFAMLLLTNGAVRVRVHSTFANQAYIVVGEKPAPVPIHTEEPPVADYVGVTGHSDSL